MTDDHRVFLDEADESLFLENPLRGALGVTPSRKHPSSSVLDAAASSMQPQNAGNIDASSAYTASANQFHQTHNVYVHDNILFKFTSPNEHVYTAGGSLGLAQEKTGYGNNQFSAVDAMSAMHSISKNPISDAGMTTLNDKSSAMRG